MPTYARTVFPAPATRKVSKLINTVVISQKPYVSRDTTAPCQFRYANHEIAASLIARSPSLVPAAGIYLFGLLKSRGAITIQESLFDAHTSTLTSILLRSVSVSYIVC